MRLTTCILFNSQLPTSNSQGAWGVGNWRLGIVVLVLAATAGCSKPAVEETVSETVVPVMTAPAVTGPIRGRVHATGLVSPAPGGELVVVAPEAARIVDIPHAEGDRVRQGDILVRFEIPNTAAEVQKQVAEVARAQAALANAKANQIRARELFGRGIAARKDVEDADRAVADAEAAVAQAEAARAAANLVAARSVVRATFDGVVAKRYHNPGDLVEPVSADPVLRVIDPRRLEVVASVPLADSPRIMVGAPAHLTAVAAGAPEVRLKVLSRPAAVEVGTATIPVRLAFNAPTNFPAGTPVEIEIDAERHPNAVLIPAPALVREGEETAVFVVNGDKAERRAVQIGLTDGEHIEIVSGVKAGDMVIVDGQAGLPDGAAIRIDTGAASDVKPPADAADKGEK
jgi:membrane fusion protein (multidrug efflux system)